MTTTFMQACAVMFPLVSAAARYGSTPSGLYTLAPFACSHVGLGVCVFTLSVSLDRNRFVSWSFEYHRGDGCLLFMVYLFDFMRIDRR